VPAHLDIAVGRNVQSGRWSRLPQRQTKGPAAEDVPLCRELLEVGAGAGKEPLEAVKAPRVPSRSRRRACARTVALAG
jgi:hypothetical protein